MWKPPTLVGKGHSMNVVYPEAVRGVPAQDVGNPANI